MILKPSASESLSLATVLSKPRNRRRLRRHLFIMQSGCIEPIALPRHCRPLQELAVFRVHL